MVVVADEGVGDAAHDTPVSIQPNAVPIVTKEQHFDFLDRPIAETESQCPVSVDPRCKLREGEIFCHVLVLLVGKDINIRASLYDGDKPLSKELLFSPHAKVSDLKHALAHCCDNYPSVDSITAVVSGANGTTTELKCDDSEIGENGIDFGETKTCIIKIRREDTLSDEGPPNDVWLELRVVDARYQDEKIKLHWSLLVKNTTKKYEICDFVKNSPNLLKDIDPLTRFSVFQIRNILIVPSDNTDADASMEQLGLDFKSPNVLTMELTTRAQKSFTSQSKRRLNIDHNVDNMTALWSYKCLLNSNREMRSNDFTFEHDEEISPQSPEVEVRSEAVYVGLVNQAMTCYLNSLLQALYMTPEFRNALYNWVYVDSSEKDEANSMPYQLQRLFLNLQTSKKNAVETTALTKSFGWDSTEAWQQHDIQELCRVMFDALEQKFKNTEQADLINRLYEGKMIDYVKCLECGTEKSREDTFLDIPLPVRPFNSSVAYDSVEKALQAFVQPETLDEVNQYFCETCNKKCDAHKGLKFTKFPYLLTLHLKRFDFDYNTYHRIKLNDKVTFPDTLHLNSFISSKDNEPEASSPEDDGGLDAKCDKSSTTDSGNSEECLPYDNGVTPTEPTIPNHEEDDEGIAISNCPSTSNGHSQENEHHLNTSHDSDGPYQYELFSIMIHSGSASGGHYYAYIKDFRTNDWLCFNDQNVSPITRDDIQKTYGGGPSRAYYSGAYSSSTNAYMLMYRQIDAEKNTLPMKVEDFPKHIQELLKKMKEQEEEKRTHERLLRMYKNYVYCHHPTAKTVTQINFLSLIDDSLSETVEKAYKTFNLQGIVDFDQCRLVDYCPHSDVIKCSYEGREHHPLKTILQSHAYVSRHIVVHMLLDIRKKDEQFKEYHAKDITTINFVADATTKKIIDGPYTLRISRSITLEAYKTTVASLLPSHLQRRPMKLALPNSSTDINIILENENGSLRDVNIDNGSKVIVELKLDTKPLRDSTIYHDLYENIVMLHMPLPDTRRETLERMNMPPWEGKEKTPGKVINGPAKINGDALKSETAPPQRASDDPNSWTAVQGEGGEWQEQSNSEDSSLSDSDRTLVGDASEDDEFELADIDAELHKNVGDADDEVEYFSFFRVGQTYGDPPERLKLYVDKRIKVEAFKKYLEPIIKVPVKYFEIIQSQQIGQSIISSESKYMRSSDRPFEDGESIIIKFRPPLRDNEFRLKVYSVSLHPPSFTPEYRCSLIVNEESTVAQLKKDLFTELKLNAGEIFCRLRKKCDKIPGKFLMDDQKIKDLDLRLQPEIIIQELDGKDLVTDPNQIVILISRYPPEMSEYTETNSQPFEEVILNNSSLAELKEKFVEMKKNPDNLSFIVAKWPSSMYIKVHELSNNWMTFTDNESQPLTLDDSSVIFYKDSTEDEHSEYSSRTRILKWNKEYTPAGGSKVRRSSCRGDPADKRRLELPLKIILDDK